MADVIDVPAPSPTEDRRLLAVAVNDLYKTMDFVIVHNARYFLPGEAVEEMQAAWDRLEAPAMAALVRDLAGLSPAPTVSTEDTILADHGLTGESGAIKRSMLSRFKDSVYRFFTAEPRTTENIRNAAETASGYFELGATVVKSVPGYDRVEEFLSLTRMLLGLRARRGV